MKQQLLDVTKSWAIKRLDQTGRCFDDSLLFNLSYIYQAVNFQDYDTFIIIDGKEGRGKSTLGIQVGAVLDPNFNLTKVCFTFKEFFEALKNSSKGDVIIFDEASMGLYNRNMMSDVNILLTQIFQIMRAKNLIIIMIIPNFFMIDQFIRDHRVDCLIHIYKRGRFAFYDDNTARALSNKGYRFKNHSAQKGNFKGRFNKKFPNNINYEAYIKRKKEFIKQTFEDVSKVMSRIGNLNYKTKPQKTKNILDSMPNMVPLSKVARKIGVESNTLSDRAKDGKIPSKKLGSMFFVEEKVAQQIITLGYDSFDAK